MSAKAFLRAFSTEKPLDVRDVMVHKELTKKQKLNKQLDMLFLYSSDAIACSCICKRETLLVSLFGWHRVQSIYDDANDKLELAQSLSLQSQAQR